MYRFRYMVFCISALFNLAPASSPEPQTETTCTFGFRFMDEVSRYKINSVFLLPNEQSKLRPSRDFEDVDFMLYSEHIKIQKEKKNDWVFRAPVQSGIYRINVFRTDIPDTMRFNIVVLIPAEKVTNGYLNGYRIGHYPQIALRNLPIYDPPRGFIEVTEQNEETLLTPHFHLKQFLCKQQGGYPKYVVIREKLLLKLELILQEMNIRGYECRSFVIMSGYRTPFYNKAIGNVKYSRHVYGGAADIYIDEHPVDGTMDDLNKDGQHNWKDAKIMYDIIDDLYGKSFYERFIGGLGRYKKTNNHGPFVHIDVRGFRARWGD